MTSQGVPRELRRDEEAREVWAAVYPALSEGSPGILGALTARGEAQVMSLAAIYAALDCSLLIRVPHLHAALAVWDYAVQSVAYIFGDSLGDPVADEILRALRQHSNGMTRNELRDHFGRNRSSEVIGRALGTLAGMNLARCENEDTGGRPAERWYAVTRKGGA